MTALFLYALSCATGPQVAQVRTLPSPGAAARTTELEARLQTAVDERGDEPSRRAHHVDEDGSPLYVNRLALETSPYLLQHAHNPVDWYPWGDEAFERARAEGKPVFLSVGYSTCHWCHVMERESFEDLEIAALLNEHFVCVKVDREERPDVDEVYMAAVNALTGRGGWPMTLLLTADRQPFFAGTYLPARDGDRGARMGLLTLLTRVRGDWASDRRDAMVTTARDVSLHLQRMTAPQPPGDVPTLARAAALVEALRAGHDLENGGFGGAPKFPRPASLAFLLRWSARIGDVDAADMVVRTLEHMAAGGIHDQLGGGFHRYTVDAQWEVPHFEKMLYDNAQLAEVYLDAYLRTGDPAHAAVVRTTLDALVTAWTLPDGGLLSATDADSLSPAGEAVEGWYFTWTPTELRQVLSADDARFAAARWGVRAVGPMEGRSVLTDALDPDAAAAATGAAPEGATARAEAARRALLAHRATRPEPLADDKVIVAWNALAISALARAGSVLDEADWVALASDTARFLLREVVDDDGRLQRTWRSDRARHAATLEDHAFLVRALLDLHEATADVGWLEQALALQRAQDLAYAAPDGGWFRTPHDGEALLTRSRTAHDGALPSGNAVALDNVLRLHTWTQDDTWQQTADRGLAALGHHVDQGTSAPALAAAVLHRRDTPLEVVVVYPDGTDPSALVGVVRRADLPHRALLIGTEDQLLGHASHVPWSVDKVPRDGQPTAYVCERGLCQQPTSDPEVLGRQLAIRPMLAP